MYFAFGEKTSASIGRWVFMKRRCVCVAAVAGAATDEAELRHATPRRLQLIGTAVANLLPEAEALPYLERIMPELAGRCTNLSTPKRLQLTAAQAFSAMWAIHAANAVKLIPQVLQLCQYLTGLVCRENVRFYSIGLNQVWFS